MKFDWLSRLVTFMSFTCVTTFLFRQRVEWLWNGVYLLSAIVLIGVFIWKKEAFRHRPWMILILLCVNSGLSVVDNLLKKSYGLSVKFHEILYTLFSGDPLQVGVQRSTVHCSGPLSAEVDFANQGLAVKDQYALVKPLDLDHLSAQSLAHFPGCVIDVNVALGVDFP